MADTASGSTGADITGAYTGLTEIYVSTTGSDSNDGLSSGTPKLTLAAIVTLAESNLASNNPTRVNIANGTYRESLVLNNSDTDWLIFEAATAGQVFIKGSDDWSGGWTNVSGNRWSIAWTNNWGMAAIPSGWEGQSVPDESRRREMVYMDGTPLKGVSSTGELTTASDDLTTGTFYVDEAANLLYIEHTTSPNTGLVEVSIRQRVIDIQNKTNLIIDGCVFQHESSGIGWSGGLITGVDTLYIVDCSFTYNAHTGVSVQQSDNVTFKDSAFDYNGHVGLDINSVTEMFWDTCTGDYNNWRHSMYGWRGWSVAGIKWFLLHRLTVNGGSTSNNRTRGFWLDTDVEDYRVENLTIADNETNAMFLEALQGPGTIKNCEIYRNGSSTIPADGAILLGNAELLHWEDNDIYDNYNFCFVFGGNAAGRPYTNFETSVPDSVSLSAGWSMVNNRIVNKGSGQRLINFQVGGNLNASELPSGVYTDNIFWNGDDSKMCRNSHDLYMSEWFVGVGDDTGLFLDPVYTAPDDATPNFTTGYTTPAAENRMTATYYQDKDLVTQVAQHTNHYHAIDFDFEYRVPTTKISPADTYSVKWEGVIKAPAFTETYTFYCDVDDGCKLIVNSTTVIDQMSKSGRSEVSGNIALTASNYYDFELQFNEGGGQAYCSLSWESTSVSKTVIPASAFWEIGYTPAPVITPISDVAYTEGDTITAISVVTTDPDSNLSTVDVTGLPTGLSHSGPLGNSSITGTIDSAASGSSPYTVTVTATDADSNQDVETFIITVAASASEAPGGTIIDLLESYVTSGDMLRLYWAHDHDSGAIPNSGATAGSLDMTITNATYNASGPSSILDKITTAGTTDKLSIPHGTDIQALATGTVFWLCNITGRSHDSAALLHKGNFDDFYSAWQGTDPYQLNWRKQGSSGGGRNATDNVNWNDSLGWALLVYTWCGSGCSTPDDRLDIHYGAAGANVAETTYSTQEGISGSVTNTNDLYIWSRTSTTNRVTYGDIAAFGILDIVLTDAQMDAIALLIEANPPTVASAIADFTVLENAADWTQDLNTTFTSLDEAAADLVKSVTSNSNETLVDASITGGGSDTLTLDFLTNQWGTATIVVRATDGNGQYIEDTFTVTVDGKPDIAGGGLPDVTVAKDAADTLVNLNTYFTDPESLTMTYSVPNNTNAGLVSTSISTNTLTLAYAAGQSGDATITVRATDPAGNTTDQIFDVTVNAEPVWGTLPARVMTEGDPQTMYDLSAFITDDIDPITSMTYEVVAGHDASLCTPSFGDENDPDLTVALVSGSGSTTITVRATDTFGETADASFTLTVNAAAGAPATVSTATAVTRNVTILPGRFRRGRG